MQKAIFCFVISAKLKWQFISATAYLLPPAVQKQCHCFLLAYQHRLDIPLPNQLDASRCLDRRPARYRLIAFGPDGTLLNRINKM